MDRRFGNAFIAAALLAGGLWKMGQAASLDPTGATPLRIAVHLVNRAGISETLLDQVGKNAAGIFLKIGVEALVQTGNDREDQPWVSLPPPCHLYVHIITMDTINKLGAHPCVISLGMVLGSAEDVGTSVIFIFDDKVNMWLIREKQISKSCLLSYAIAHEIGHILLRRNSHSACGIMQGKWDYRAICDMVAEMLTFHGKEAERIRAEVAHRCARQ
jgi:hypothetical protein